MGNPAGAAVHFQTCRQPSTPVSGVTGKTSQMRLLRKGIFSSGACLIYREIERLLPDNPESHLELGARLARPGAHPDETIREYREALRLEPRIRGGANPAGRMDAGHQHRSEPPQWRGGRGAQRKAPCDLYQPARSGLRFEALAAAYARSRPLCRCCHRQPRPHWKSPSHDGGQTTCGGHSPEAVAALSKRPRAFSGRITVNLRAGKFLKNASPVKLLHKSPARRAIFRKLSALVPQAGPIPARAPAACQAAPPRTFLQPARGRVRSHHRRPPAPAWRKQVYSKVCWEKTNARSLFAA